MLFINDFPVPGTRGTSWDNRTVYVKSGRVLQFCNNESWQLNNRMAMTSVLPQLLPVVRVEHRSFPDVEETLMLKLLFVVLFVTASVSAQSSPKADPWNPLRFLVGVWEGSGKSDSGDSNVEREYKFALNDKFLQQAQRSTYAPKAKDPKAQVHEDVGFFSYDKARKQFVFRQFNSEGFVVQFVVTSISDDGKSIVLDSEINENIPKDMRSRVTYKILNDNDFTETYDIAEPGKDFVTYFAKHFKRKKQ